jgi:ATP-dependent HslUV protease ATP-binding subunit HslU
MHNLTPQQIVEALDQHIIGQAEAKRAVAVAIRNRWRRQQLPPEVACEVSPKNIIMIGPTGVGKTEIARRIATLTGAPFIKIEASKFTEVGYHGRDVESMVRDLLEQAIGTVRAEQAEHVQQKAAQQVEQRLLDLLLPLATPSAPVSGYVAPDDATQRREQAREKMLEQLRSGALDERMVEITTTSKAVSPGVFANMGLDQMDPEMSKLFEQMIPNRTQRQRVTVSEARRILQAEETENLIDRDKLIAQAIERTEQSGIVFLDEIDKIASATGADGRSTPDVSRQGVQRDLLPIVEGTTVSTRHGNVQTDHILFVAAGAFHSTSVSDLMPELQGRFPIRVELNPLNKDDFVRILTEPDNALTRQQQSLLETEGLHVSFDDAAIDALAELAAQVNAEQENIGARRLITVMECLFEPIHFEAVEMAGRGETQLRITDEMVRQRLAPIMQSEDLSRFVL